MTFKVKNIPTIISFILLCQLAGVLGSFFTLDSILTWYATLNKPSFNPPNWIFGPVWTTLYTMMGISLYLIGQKGLKNKKVKFAFWLFLVHLAVNTLWSIIFFGLQNLSLALVVIIILWILIIWTIYLFYKLNTIAAYLLIPYAFWVSFATILNYFILKLN